MIVFGLCNWLIQQCTFYGGVHYLHTNRFIDMDVWINRILSTYLCYYFIISFSFSFLLFWSLLKKIVRKLFLFILVLWLKQFNPKLCKWHFLCKSVDCLYWQCKKLVKKQNYNGLYPGKDYFLSNLLPLMYFWVLQAIIFWCRLKQTSSKMSGLVKCLTH